MKGKGGPFGKRSKYRVVPLSARASRLLETHFVLEDSFGLTPRTAQRRIKAVANRARLIKPVTPHVLRHTFAVECIRRGLSVAVVQKILGHDNLSTTQIYLNLSGDNVVSHYLEKW